MARPVVAGPANWCRITATRIAAAAAVAALVLPTSIHPGEDKPNRIERTAKKVADGTEKTAKRAGKFVEKTAKRSAKFVEKTATRAGKFVEKTATKTGNAVKRAVE